MEGQGLAQAVHLGEYAPRSMSLRSILVRGENTGESMAITGCINGGKRYKVFLRANGRCEYCGKPLEIDKTFQIDHKDPLGGNEEHNLALSCTTCNSRKSHCDVEQFRHRLRNMVARHVVDALEATEKLEAYAKPEELEALRDALKLARNNALDIEISFHRDGEPNG